MSQWITALSEMPKGVDPEVLEESALARAQATIEAALRLGRINRAELARRMGRSRPYVSRMLSGDHNLTIRTFARALVACGFEPRFERDRIQWGWAQNTCESAWNSSMVNRQESTRSSALLPVSEEAQCLVA